MRWKLARISRGSASSDDCTSWSRNSTDHDMVLLYLFCNIVVGPKLVQIQIWEWLRVDSWHQSHISEARCGAPVFMETGTSESARGSQVKSLACGRALVHRGWEAGGGVVEVAVLLAGEGGRGAAVAGGVGVVAGGDRYGWHRELLWRVTR